MSFGEALRGALAKARLDRAALRRHLATVRVPASAEAVGAWCEGRVVPGPWKMDRIFETVQMPIHERIRVRDRLRAEPAAAAVEALCEASAAADLAGVSARLASGVNLGAPGPDGRTALEHAITSGAVEVVALLLDRGASFLDVPRERASQLADVIRAGRSDLAEPLLEHGASLVDAARSHPQELLRLAALAPGDPHRLVERILTQGVLPGPISHQEDPILVAAIAQGNLRSAEVLLDAGADPRCRDRRHTTALALAAARGAVDLVRRLRALGAELNATNTGGETAMHLASATGAEAAVAQLLEWGAAVHLTDRNGRTPAAVAKSAGHDAIARRIVERAPECGPRWLREARKRGVRRIELFYGKADGFCFDPHDVDRPLLVGGDYDGAYPLGAQDVLASRDAVDRLVAGGGEWFVPFIHMLREGADFGLDDIAAAGSGRRYRVITGAPRIV